MDVCEALPEGHQETEAAGAGDPEGARGTTGSPDGVRARSSSRRCQTEGSALARRVRRITDIVGMARPQLRLLVCCWRARACLSHACLPTQAACGSSMWQGAAAEDRATIESFGRRMVELCGHESGHESSLTHINLGEVRD